ncbi:unnamed protein product [Rhizoctonia solani]|uniref:Nephrocystin 3-like N-terminal domain-containing protein n=1 Tax=Rhizoctonia solani TaxID=456999 RepID=A0A8H3B7D2_9AGAM|nr:unnamed protein product [Rhizoctonia solani]
MRTRTLPLKKIKRFRIRENKSSSSTEPNQFTESSPPQPTPLDSPLQPSRCAKGWSHLKRLTTLLVPVSGAFSPLKEVVDNLIECIEFYEREADGQHEYVVLQNELEALFKDLEAHLVCSSPTMTPCVEGLYRWVFTAGSVSTLLKYRYKAPLSKSSIALLASRKEELPYDPSRATYNDYQVMEQHFTDAQSDRASNRLNRLAPSLSAQYNSTQALGLKRGPCTEGTRVNALAHMTTWIQDSTPGGIYWLNGMAGTGKTTIAYSLCAELDSNCKLAASFFCSRLLPECRDASLILPSIAYQLARFSLPFQFALSKVLERDPDVHTRLPQVQFDALIAKPLLDVQMALPSDLVVLVDGLDECKDEEHTGHVLGVLLNGLIKLPIKFIISSRPEPEIRGWMNGRASAKLVLHELDKCMVQSDIEAYLRIALRPINPPESKLAALVQRAGILFIYASTVVRYISYKQFCRNPHARLDAVLNASTSETIPNTEIDQLYSTILQAALDDQKINQIERNDMKQVLNTVICAQEPLAIGALSKLLQLYDLDRVRAALDPLWSVLYVSETSEVVTPLHVSFPEYMLDPARSKQYNCNFNAQSQTMTQLCFGCIRSADPQFNICQLESSCIPDEQVEDLDLRINRTISTELFYACRYWAHHLYNANGATILNNPLEDFLSNRLLLWLEVLNLKKTVRFVGKSINLAEIWCKRNGCTSDLIELAHDCWRFASIFALNPISKSTPHIYISMLPFWPQSSPIGRYYRKRAQGMIQVEGAAMSRHHLAPLAIWSFKGLRSASSSPDGTSIALALGSQLFVVDAFSGRVAVGPFTGHTQAITTVAFSYDGAYIVSGSQNGTLCTWHAQNGEIALGPLRGHIHEITCAKYSPDGSRVVSGSRDKTVRVWDALSGKVLLVLEGHVGPVLSVTFISNGTWIASGSVDKTIRVWDTMNGAALIEPITGHTNSVTCVVSSPKGLLVSGSSDKTICVWNVPKGELLLGPLQGHTSSVTCIVFSPDGSRMVSGSYDCCLRVWDTQSGDMIFGQLQGHTSAVSWIGFSPKGTRMMSSGAWDNTICVWDAQTQTNRLQPRKEMTYPITSAAVSSDAKRIAAGTKSGSVCVRDLLSGSIVVGPFGNHTSRVVSVGISPNGQLVGWGDCNSKVFVWDIHSQVMVGSFLGHHSEVNTVAFTPDNTRIISSSDSLMHIHDVRSGKSILTLDQKRPSLRQFGLSPDGTRIATGSADGSINVWDSKKGYKVLGPLRGQSKPTISIAYSPDGTRIISASKANTMCAWDAQNGHLLVGPFGEQDRSPTTIAFSTDGTRIVSGFLDGTIFIWEAQTGDVIVGPIEGHREPVTMVNFLSDNSQVISHSRDGALRIHDVRKVQPFHLNGIGRRMSEDGWVTDDQSNLLCWVPHDLHANLMWQRTTGLISAVGDVRLQFNEACIRKAWTESYAPSM